jgi:hypothetical protein
MLKMIKKLIALAAGAVFSMNASAGYVQYDFNLNTDNTGLTGSFVQHDDDQSIAFFAFFMYGHDDRWAQFFPFFSEGYVLIVDESTYFRNNGPTNFVIRDNFGGDHVTDLSVNFTRSNKGAFEYTATYRMDLYANMPPVIYSGTVSGLATKGTVDPALARYLDSVGGYESGVPRIIPTYIGPAQVPEPASLSLFAIGALGVASIVRRRKT